MNDLSIDPRARYVVPMLRITQCSDPMRWYAHRVGQLVPHRAQFVYLGDLERISVEPSGHINFVQREDAKAVMVSVSGKRLDEWPYQPVRHLARQMTATCGVDVVVRDGPAHEGVKPGPKTCKGTCGRLGICQAPDDCEDAPKPVHPEGPHGRLSTEGVRVHDEALPLGQSRAHSMAETLSSIAVGFVVSMGIQAVLLPALGHDITLAQNFLVTCVFTVASVLRGYGMRRLFNHLHTRKAKP